jgi:hypothetical protein
MPFFGLESPWSLDEWPWQHGAIRVLPVLHGSLELTRAVRAHLDVWRPDTVVVEVPEPAGAAWREALTRMPRIQAVQVETEQETAWLLLEPTDPLVEAGRWALERRRGLVAGDLLVPGYPRSRQRFPDTAAIPRIGYRTYLDAVAGLGRVGERSQADADRERALAAAALEHATGGRRVALVVGLSHARPVLKRLQSGETGTPFRRPVRARCGAAAVADEALGEVLSHAPFVQAAWERARRGGLPCPYTPPEGAGPAAKVLSFPGSESMEGAPEREPGEDPDDQEELRALARGDDMLCRPRLTYRLVQQASRYQQESGGGSVPNDHERRILHRHARNMALLDERLCPDLYELAVAARGAVDDRFAQDLLALALRWPWGQAGGIHLRASDLGQASRLVRLRPRLDRLAKRPGLRRALQIASEGHDGPPRICSHPPEDLLVEALGADLKERGQARASGGGVRSVPFGGSLLDGIDVRETLRRMVVGGQVWVREEVPVRAQVGAVVVIFAEDEDRVAGVPASDRFPWCEVWHGEHDEESDMAFYASPPEIGRVAPGIYRAEYGGFMLTWPRGRLGDVWHDPAYDPWARTRPERLLLAALDHSPHPAVVFVARRPPGTRLLSLARRMGRRILHVPPGAVSHDRLRRLRQFHVLAGPHLRPLADELLR